MPSNEIVPVHVSLTNFSCVIVSLTRFCRFIAEKTTLAEGQAQPPEKEVTDKEKDMIESFKPLLQAFLHNKDKLQVVAIYALQVFCFSRNFPKVSGQSCFKKHITLNCCN